MVQALEDQLGLALFVCTRGKLTLTPEAYFC